MNTIHENKQVVDTRKVRSVVQLLDRPPLPKFRVHFMNKRSWIVNKIGSNYLHRGVHATATKIRFIHSTCTLQLASTENWTAYAKRFNS